MKLKNFKSRKGFTLIEIVAAVAIMGIAFVALISLFSTSTTTNKVTRDKGSMMMIAQGLMEQSIKKDGFSGLSAVIGTNTINLDPLYTASYDATRTVSSVNSHLLKVKISVKEKTMPDFSTGVILVSQLSDVS
jgi:type II secretion system protein I